MLDTVKEYIIATRPWSFTAGIIPVLITAAVSQVPITSTSFIRATIMAMAVQAGGNLTNTYFDYTNGVDTKASPTVGDRTLVDKKVNPFGLFLFSIVCYLGAIIAVAPLLLINSNRQLLIIFCSGMVLTYFYTANPVGLKYRALGDITIVLCFGPLLFQATSLILTGNLNNQLYLYSIPTTLLTEGILHVNNARDIKADSQIGAISLAVIVGFDNSLILFKLLVLAAYMSCAILGIWYSIGCFLPLLTVPQSLGIIKSFSEKNMTNLPEEVAKLHLPFGLLLFVGIWSTSMTIL